MRIAAVLERPTQFDVPLFRYAARDADHDLRVVYTDPTATAAAFDPELGRTVSWGDDLQSGYECVVAPAHGRMRWLRGQLGQRCDLVIVNGYTRRSYLAATLAARRAGSPTALRLDSVLFDEGSGPRRLAKRALFRLVVTRLFDLFLGVSTSTLDYLRDLGIPGSRTGLFPYPVDVEGLRHRSDQRDAVRERLGLPADAKVVMAVAKLHPRETPWDLLRAWREAASPDRWLLLVGDGPDRQAVESFLAEQGLPRVVLAGYVPYNDLPGLFAACDVLVHAPREERWGVSVAEALACGRPVVACDRVGAAYDLLREGRNGFTYRAGDVAALTARLGDALRLPLETVAASSEGPLGTFGVAAAWGNVLAAARGANAP